MESSTLWGTGLGWEVDYETSICIHKPFSIIGLFKTVRMHYFTKIKLIKKQKSVSANWSLCKVPKYKVGKSNPGLRLRGLAQTFRQLLSSGNTESEDFLRTLLPNRFLLCQVSCLRREGGPRVWMDTSLSDS